MKRRTFFKTTALGSSALAVTGLAGCRTTSKKTKKNLIFQVSS
jgi:hypothetical protein